MASEDEFDPFAVQSGAMTGIGPFQGEVIESTFTTSPEYNDGKSWFMEWKVLIEDANLIESGIRDRRVSFTLGNNWSSPDGGLTSEYTDINSGQVERRTYHINSRMGALVARAFQSSQPVVDAGDGSVVWDGNGFDLIESFKERGKTPFDSDAWTGFRFQFEPFLFEYGKDREGNQIPSRHHDMPTQVLSAPDQEEETPKPAKKAAKKKAAAPKVAAPKVLDIDVEAAKDQILTAGEDLDDNAEFDEFVEMGTNMLTEMGVPTDHELFTWLTDAEAGAWSAYE